MADHDKVLCVADFGPVEVEPSTPGRGGIGNSPVRLSSCGDIEMCTRLADCRLQDRA